MPRDTLQFRGLPRDLTQQMSPISAAVPFETDVVAVAAHCVVRVRFPNYCGRVESLETTGEFWSPDNTAKRVPGTLTWEPGSRPRIKLNCRVIDELNEPVEVTETGLTIVHRGDPASIVQDGLARVLLGDTEAGPVTGVDSYLQHLPKNLFDFETPPLQQVWEPYTLVVGAHLPTGHAATLDAVRFILDGPGWWEQLPDAGSATSDAGELLCERGDDKLNRTGSLGGSC